MKTSLVQFLTEEFDNSLRLYEVLDIHLKWNATFLKQLFFDIYFCFTTDLIFTEASLWRNFSLGWKKQIK